MAAPTNVRVESNSQTTATLRWMYAGSAQIAVYRSTDGASYSEITTAGDRVAVGTTIYIDSTLAVGTCTYGKWLWKPSMKDARYLVRLWWEGR